MILAERTAPSAIMLQFCSFPLGNRNNAASTSAACWTLGIELARMVRPETLSLEPHQNVTLRPDLNPQRVIAAIFGRRLEVSGSSGTSVDVSGG